MGSTARELTHIAELNPPSDRTARTGPEGDEAGSQKDTAERPTETVVEQTDRSEVSTVGEWQRQLRDSDDLTPAEQHIGFLLSTWMNYEAKEGRKVDTNFGYGHSVSQETIAEKSGRSVSTVGRALAGLEAKGFLYVHQRQGRTSIYGATVPTGGTVHPLPTPVISEGPPPSPEGEDPRHQRGTAYTPDTNRKQQGPASFTEPTIEEVEEKARAKARAETLRRKSNGHNIGKVEGYTKSLIPDFTDQARSELLIERCPRCDTKGFVDIDDSTRAKCSHPAIYERETHEQTTA